MLKKKAGRIHSRDTNLSGFLYLIPTALWSDCVSYSAPGAFPPFFVLPAQGRVNRFSALLFAGKVRSRKRMARSREQMACQREGMGYFGVFVIVLYLWDKKLLMKTQFTV
jgi:hypothetical protein